MALFQAAVLALAGLVGVQPAPAQHPLDPLSAEEIRTAARAMRADPRLGGAAFPLITLAEPAKAEVLGWGAGNALARRARVLAATAAGMAEVEVDLVKGRVVSFTRREGVQGSLTLTEYMEGARLALAHPEFQAGLKRRGVTDPKQVKLVEARLLASQGQPRAAGAILDRWVWRAEGPFSVFGALDQARNLPRVWANVTKRGGPINSSSMPGTALTRSCSAM